MQAQGDRQGRQASTRRRQDPAGKTKTIKVKAKFKKKGKIKATVKVTSKNAGKKTVKKNVTVK